MQLETKFLRLRQPVTIGSRFGHWRVCWLGGWTRYRLFYLVMVVRVRQCLTGQSRPCPSFEGSAPIHGRGCVCGERARTFL